MTFKYPMGATLAINLIGGDSLMTLTDTGHILRDGRQDVGTGTVIERKVVTDNHPDDPDTVLYRMSVIDGRFDVHRNDLGQLWANEFELRPLET